MGGFFGQLGSLSGGSGGASVTRLGPPVAYASPAGVIAAAPPGFVAGTSFTTGTGVVSVTLAAGNATWSSMTAGAPGQLCEIRNDDGANTLTLPAADWGGPGDITLTPGNKVLSYYDGRLGSWQLTAP